MSYSFEPKTTSETLTQEVSVCELANVGVTFGSGSEGNEVLRDINLSLFAGDFVCVLGSSGCGKTTLLRVLAGYQPPTTGIVTVAGRRHTEPDPDVGVVFQRPNLFPWLTITKNVEFGPKMKGVSDRERKQRVSATLEMVGLSEAANFLPYQLSGGMQQRAAIARTLAAEPAIILMDEPFGALDALTRESIQTHLRGIWQRTGKTIFFITHDVEETLLLATRIVILHARPGRVVKDIFNPFAYRDHEVTPASLRLSREFLEMRQNLVDSIRTDDI
ncbi:MAG: ABC transporter ATP-binding protein [Microcystis sp.]|jgi:taurine transport system ATP-binding protein|uniref:Taurine import ATP-binding protein TauB n=1 Tax=Microcystis aeruginosa PCC 9701 TaxID=721123 RepID=I4IRI9_MICAE|nr:ABC transporter ATP-binding protein [Microcystis aeruginosa]CCI36913.1 Taurine import ATP-binding protein TauB [Microcystis aeruginosa PCC 9701]